MQESIFTKIIKGELPAYKIYEDDKTVAFLDINPIQPGHTLVVPKKQIDQLWDLPDEDYQAVMATSKKVALRLRNVLKVPRVGVQVEGVDVAHAHVKLIPFNTASEYHARRGVNVKPDSAYLESMANRLKF